MTSRQNLGNLEDNGEILLKSQTNKQIRKKNNSPNPHPLSSRILSVKIYFTIENEILFFRQNSEISSSADLHYKEC